MSSVLPRDALEDKAKAEIVVEEIGVNHRNYHLAEGLQIFACAEPDALPAACFPLEIEVKAVLHFGDKSAALRLIKEAEVDAVVGGVAAKIEADGGEAVGVAEGVCVKGIVGAAIAV